MKNNLIKPLILHGRLRIATWLSLALSILAQPALAQSSWSTSVPLPLGGNSLAGAAINGIFYVAAGQGQNGAALATLQAYNSTNKAWSSLAALPSARYLNDGMAVISNKLYFPGGWTFSPPLPNNNLWVYDPVANAWSSAANMPLLSGEGACGVISNLLYVITPENGYSGYYSYLNVYNPAANNWTQLANSPRPHAGPGAGVLGGKFYVAGGFDDFNVTNILDVYDPASNTWSTKSPMHTTRQDPGSAVINGCLYIIGGHDPAGNVLNTVEIYNPTNDTWTVTNAMPTSRNRAAVGVVNGVAYVAGGANSTNSYLTTVEALNTRSAVQVTTISAHDPLITEPQFLTSDGLNLFVTGVGTGNDQHVFRIPAQGGAASILYNADNPGEIALLGNSIFWIDPNAGPITDTEILKAPANGNGTVTPIYIGSQVGQPIVDGNGLASDGIFLYAADEVSGTVWRLKPDGSGLTQLGPSRYSGGFSTEHFNEIAVNQGTVYLADSGQHTGSPQVVSIATNGSSFATLYSGAPLVIPVGIAVGNGVIYVADPGANNTIWQLPLGGGTPTALISGPPFNSIQGLNFINGVLYIVDAGGDAIYAINVPGSAVQPPVATAMTVSRVVGQTVKISLADLATNWTDPGGYPVELTAINLTSTNGQPVYPLNLQTNLDGSYLVTNNAFLGYVNPANVNDQINYTISDSQGGTATGLINLVISTSPLFGQATGIVSPGGHSATLSFAGYPGYNYSVQRSTNLIEWKTIWTTNAPPAGPFRYTDNFGDLGGIVPNSAYYRLAWNP